VRERFGLAYSLLTRLTVARKAHCCPAGYWRPEEKPAVSFEEVGEDKNLSEWLRLVKPAALAIAPDRNEGTLRRRCPRCAATERYQRGGAGKIRLWTAKHYTSMAKAG
jgi:hypothetical protein